MQENAKVTNAPLITVIMACRNEERLIARTLECIVGQKSADGRPLAEWGEVVVVDDESTDGTPQILAEIRQQHPEVTVLRNETRRRTSGSYNRAIEVARAPVVLTCHADCRPCQTDYLWNMLAHFADPSVGAVTGKPVLGSPEQLTFVDKVYLVTHMMDIEPEAPVVREINFQEERCDGFRKEGLIKAGLFIEKPGIVVEDQILAAGLRRHGYRILQDTSLRYELFAGGSKGTLARIIKSHLVYSRGQVFIMQQAGLSTTKLAVTSKNRRQRRLLRMSQATVPLVWCAGAIVLGCFSLRFSALYVGISLLIRYVLLLGQNRGLCSHAELIRMYPTVIACDVIYGWGFFRGLCQAALGKPIQ